MTVAFTSTQKLRAKATAAFGRHRQRIARLLPHADIHHVGSTAIPGAITKGDLDLVVRVARNDFALADNVLARHYMRNTASHRSRSFSSFKDDEADPPLGIQLTVRGGAQDHFLKFRDALVADPTLIARYNTLKHRCAGLTMAAYRRRKSAFIKRVLAHLGR